MPGGSHAVARGILHEVHGFVGEMQQLGFRARIGGIGGHADAGGDRARSDLGSFSQMVSRISLCKRRATPQAFSLEVCGSRTTNSSPP